MVTNDTIVAISTPPGRGGVGIVRLSGPQAQVIALKLTNKKQFIPRQASYCSLFDAAGELLDNAIIIYFKAPHSFTGEDVVEIQSHGSPVLLDYLVQQCTLFGARLAKPGEFSERAFLNDKIDLTQAEAIADVIQANSLHAARMAVRSLQGDFSKKISDLNEDLIHLRLYVEAAIDFPEEEIDFLADGKIALLLENIIAKLQEIRINAGQGVLIREGLSLVIAGKPNAGKSTLINRLAGREVAIVTDIAGTTRDVMREHILLDDLPLHIIDTAGLRTSDDLVEQEGIKRAWNEIKQADCILLIADIHDQEDKSLEQTLQQTISSHIPIIKVINKIDAVSRCAELQNQIVYLSAKTGEGIPLLKQCIKHLVGFQPAEGQYLARRRHLNALDAAKAFLLKGREQLSARAGELLAEDLRLAHLALCEITGEFSADDLLGKIFSSFCIGK